MREKLTRLPPGGSPISASSLLRVIRKRPPYESLRPHLSDRLDQRAITLHASGREAIRVAFRALGAATGRNEIAIPAYGCFSIPAAAVAAGMRVHLVDIGETGQLDPNALSRLPMDQIAAVVVANLFGIPDAIEDVRAIARETGTGVIDDAAQTFGGSSPIGKVGARGDIGILSFGRGKPVSALGGGAIAWSDPSVVNAHQDECQTPKRGAALLRAGIYDAARIPTVLRALSAIPALGIGETVYDPRFTQGPMPGAAAALASAILPDLDQDNSSRTQRAHRLAAHLTAHSEFTPLLARPGDLGVYPRLGVLAPSGIQREKALKALRWLGATRMYPAPLDSILDLQPHLVGKKSWPGAYDFSARILTLPTHSGMNAVNMDRLVSTVQQL